MMSCVIKKIIPEEESSRVAKVDSLRQDSLEEKHFTIKVGAHCCMALQQNYHQLNEYQQVEFKCDQIIRADSLGLPFLNFQLYFTNFQEGCSR